MELPNERALAMGDRIIFYQVGAYTMSFQPQFFIEPPPAVYVRTHAELIRFDQVNGAGLCARPTMDASQGHSGRRTEWNGPMASTLG